ncbi:hypothetical protein [Actinomadura atramentaria]|uniref:hypothetical protein n=1 Tax=Actinomadura atramentaria TaxID=1990 RepID=UPI00037369E6|nr:hypothetical protein [Actinomadura atramentaria]
MIALIRFLLAGYLRSSRVLYAVIPMVLLMALALTQWPAGLPDVRLRLGTGELGDVPAFMFPIWALAARNLINTQPDAQRDLSFMATRRTHVADLAAASIANLALAVIVLPLPLIQAMDADVPASALLAGAALTFLACLAATALGAWTAQTLMPRAATSVLVLLCLLTAVILLNLSSLTWLSIPVIAWTKAAHDGPTSFTAAFPGTALHLFLWTAVATTAYLTATRTRP